MNCFTEPLYFTFLVGRLRCVQRTLPPVSERGSEYSLRESVMAEQIPRRKNRTAETLEERRARLKMMLDNSAAERRKSLMLHGAGLTLLAAISAVCVWIIVARPTEHAFGWATNTLAWIVPAIIAYVFTAPRPTRPAGQAVQRPCGHARSRKLPG